MKNLLTKTPESASEKPSLGDANHSTNFVIQNQTLETVARPFPSRPLRLSVSPSVWTLDKLREPFWRRMAEWRIVRPVCSNSPFP
ncbi:hypothetical protein [Caballeronia terrestris]|uniref:hypothetical protein n=1 Tax=Caballeronia terrestris TaxID=1226301 RepID=UPI000F7356B3|nr:hypothetical protein [Caballeronia terrestris]